jgi:hypothetical protein
MLIFMPHCAVIIASDTKVRWKYVSRSEAMIYGKFAQRTTKAVIPHKEILQQRSYSWEW